MRQTYAGFSTHTILVVIALVLAVLALFGLAAPTLLAIAVILLCVAMLT